MEVYEDEVCERTEDTETDEESDQLKRLEISHDFETTKLEKCQSKLYDMHVEQQLLEMEKAKSIEKIENLKQAIEERRAMIQELTDFQLQKFGGGQDSQSQGAQLDQYLRAAQHQYAVLSASVNLLNRGFEKINNEAIRGTLQLKPLLKEAYGVIRAVEEYQGLVKSHLKNEQFQAFTDSSTIEEVEAQLETALKEYEQLKEKEAKTKKDLIDRKRKHLNIENSSGCVRRKSRAKKVFDKLIFGVRLVSQQVEQTLQKLQASEDRYSQLVESMKEETKSVAQPGWRSEPEYCQADARMRRPVMRGRAASAPEYEMPYTP